MFQNASDLETAALYAEELQDEIMDKITRTQWYTELSTMKQPGRISLVCQPSVKQAIVTLPASQPIVTA